MRRFSALLATACVFAASAAHALVPDPSHCTLGDSLPTNPANRHLYISIESSACGLPDACSDGRCADYTIVVRDFTSTPIPDSQVYIDFSSCIDMEIASDQLTSVTGQSYLAPKTVRGSTNPQGRFTFKVQGHANLQQTPPTPLGTPCARVYADGVLLGNLFVSAYDIDGCSSGFGAVNAGDASEVVQEVLQGGTKYQRTDVNASGTVSPADVAFMAQMVVDAMLGTGSTGPLLGCFLINIDARSLTGTAFNVDQAACLSKSQVWPLQLSGGPHLITECGGGCGFRPEITFSVLSNGTVSYDPALEPAVTGAGTNTLVVHYFPNMVNIDARGLADSLFRLDACPCLNSRQVQSLAPSVGAHTIGMCSGSGGCGIRPAISFTVQPDGTVSYDPTLEPAVMGAGTHTLVVNSFSFPPRGDDTEPSMGLFRVVIKERFWPMMASYSGFGVVNGVHRLVSPGLYDPQTVIGRSGLLHEGDAADSIVGTPVGTAGTPIADTSFTLIPAGFHGPTGTSELHTELRSLNMQDFGGLGVAVRAGIKVPGGRISPGEIQARPNAVGLYPANSFFDVFVEVDLPALGGNAGVTTLMNTSPLLVENSNLTCIPPSLVYTHGGPSGPVPIRFKNNDTQLPKRWSAGDSLGWLVLAGHGINIDTVGTAVDEFIQLVNAEPEMADTATIKVDVHDVLTFAPASAFVQPVYRDRLFTGFDAAAALGAAGNPCGAIHDLVYGLLLHVDGFKGSRDSLEWVQVDSVRQVLYDKIHAMAKLYQLQANTHGQACLPTDVEPQPVSSRVAIQYVRPNPTDRSATIGFEIARRGRVALAIFDPTGRHVRTLVDGELAAGVHQATWDGRRDGGGIASSGIYFARLISAGVEDVKRIAVIK